MNRTIGRVATTALILLVMASPLPAPVQYPDPPPGSTPGAPGCVVPYGYTWGCGYSCSTAGGECACRENEIPASICMKSNAGTGCGCFDHSSDPCCGATGF
ncbi:MAG: hypothetical protein QOI24_4289 [Acidobacteriota bacterium]|jgi:hypothetical protein|nr:hypothetical protein [Acidobacteriota bacterium]